MKGFYTKSRRFFLYQICFFLFIVLLCLFAVGMPRVPLINWLLFGCTLLICLTGISLGLLASLGISLLVLFLFGSVLIWGMYAAWPVDLSVGSIVIWMLAFLAAAIVTGLIHRLVIGTMDENEEMVRKFDDLVTIDEGTGFFNEKRFLFDLEEEFSRSRRTGIPFSLMLVEILYFDQFLILYGRKETDYLLRSLSAIIRKNTRITDRKFRLEQDKGTFAIILSNSAEEGAEIVMRKTEKILQYHTLENGNKQVTLTIAFGLKSYGDDVSDHMELVQRAKHELDHYIQ